VAAVKTLYVNLSDDTIQIMKCKLAVPVYVWVSLGQPELERHRQLRNKSIKEEEEEEEELNRYTTKEQQQLHEQRKNQKAIQTEPKIKGKRMMMHAC
jgi:hypothetical protein